jgi:mannose-1-phosphate guanylyltransferase
MKAFVLAAGFGTRLKPLTDQVPKPLVPVHGAYLVAYALRLLAKHGITEVMMNVHHHASQLMEALKDGASYGVQLSYSVEERLLGTGGGLKKAQDWLGSGAFVVVNSDIVSSINLAQAVQTHQEKRALCTMVLRHADKEDEPSSIETSDGMKVCGILGHRVKNLACTEAWMFTGVHVLHPRILSYLPENQPSCIVRQGYVPALLAGEPIQGMAYDGYWTDAGTLKTYQQLCDDVRLGRFTGV